MRTYDFSPLWRSTVGFDRLFDLAEMAQRERAGEDNYPPYNIERLAEDRYQISLAVAGFAPNDIAITAEQNVVTIEGSKPDKAERATLEKFLASQEVAIRGWESHGRATTDGRFAVALPTGVKDGKNIDPIRAAAFVDLVHTVANSNEFAYRN